MTAPALDLARIADDIDRARTMFGPLPQEARARLFAAIDNPTPENWKSARSLSVGSNRFMTLWQACQAFTDYRGVSGDAPPPSQAQIIAALAAAVR